MIVRELIALFGFQVDRRSAESVNQAITGVVQKVKALAMVAAATGAAVIFKEIAEGVAELGDEIDTTSQRIGVSAQALQELRFAATRADVSSEELTTGLRTLARNAFEASQGNKELGKDFARLGVRVRGAGGELKPVDQLLEDLAPAFARLTSDTERTALAQSVFGRSGAALVPLLKSGKEGIRAFRQEAQALGGILDDDLIRLSSDFDDSQKTLRFTLQGIKNVIGRALLPAMTRFNQAITKLIASHGALIRTSLERFLSRVAQVVESVVRVLIGAVDATLTWLEGLSPLQKQLLGIGLAAAALAALLALPGGALLLLAALIGLVIDDFMTWRDDGESVIGDLIGSLDDLKAQFPGLFSFVEGLADAFSFAFDFITNLVGSFILFFVGVWSDPLAASQEFMQQLRTLWEDLLAFLTGIFGPQATGVFEAVFDVAFDLVKGWVTGVQNLLMSLVQFVVDVFSSDLGTAFANLWDNLGFTASRFVDFVVGHFKRLADLGRRVLSLFGDAGNEGSQGQPGALALGGARDALRAAGAVVSPTPSALGRAPVGVTQSQTNNVDVKVNAQGTANPEEIGLAVARQIEGVLERHHRDALGALTPALAGG